MRHAHVGNFIQQKYPSRDRLSWRLPGVATTHAFRPFCKTSPEEPAGFRTVIKSLDLPPMTG
jgi:hypothetical protein